MLDCDSRESHTSNFPMEEETLTILGVPDNSRRGISASHINLTP